MQETISKICGFINTLINLLEKELKFLQKQEITSTISSQNKIITILQKLVDLVFKLQTAQIKQPNELLSDADQLILERFIEKIKHETEEKLKKL